ncbi:hypothetical protein GIB67_032465 [Kingdonia uniflora]|uniref:Uncharacterized protein n=1 Tax=Kingdonia uniflora TaxID=39325 RepID=A0A7J7L7G1_9MAGN|nr:hypothetical protein GIB67_032465 [Kingdonia uniflora]
MQEGDAETVTTAPTVPRFERIERQEKEHKDALERAVTLNIPHSEAFGVHTQQFILVVATQQFILVGATSMLGTAYSNNQMAVSSSPTLLDKQRPRRKRSAWEA